MSVCRSVCLSACLSAFLSISLFLSSCVEAPANRQSKCTSCGLFYGSMCGNPKVKFASSIFDGFRAERKCIRSSLRFPKKESMHIHASSPFHPVSKGSFMIFHYGSNMVEALPFKIPWANPRSSLGGSSSSGGSRPPPGDVARDHMAKSLDNLRINNE